MLVKNQIINQSILKGQSPVQGFGRFERYSDSYRGAIKNPRKMTDAIPAHTTNLPHPFGNSDKTRPGTSHFADGPGQYVTNMRGFRKAPMNFLRKV